MTRLIDPTTYYTNGAQKIIGLAMAVAVALVVSLPMISSLMMALTATSVIEQHDSDLSLLGDSPLSTMMVSGHQAVTRRSSRHIALSKAIAKMHIHKIVMDARFGQGSCLRIMQEEERASQGDAGAPSSARDSAQSREM
ncbi:unnamed protein product [Cylicocyclus nassatus]|uniref:Uncharacterized protein n=1 Tax=Cylicocyclus nassatus TaxID=53992 RepID=A0AA36GVF4_CYLNA|nr:unnamed protein product [Cylicocyclus nassatus]